MRLDRFITLNIVQPWRRLFRPLNSQRSTLNSKWPVPILMYHSISDDPEPGFSPYYKVNTSPAVFRRHMQLLADRGYRTITISELVKQLGENNKATKKQRKQGTGVRDQGSSTLNSQPSTLNSPDRRRESGGHQPSTNNHQPPTHSELTAVLTFDDGFRDFYTEAFPVLKEFGFTATMYLPTAFIGDERRQFLPRSPLSTLNSQLSTASRECLTWPEVRELRKAGIEFGSHSVNHPKLVDLDLDGVRKELSESKAAIERELGEPVTAFCHPYAFPQNNRLFVENLARLLNETGYRSCATTKLGRCTGEEDPFCLRRLPANSLDDSHLLGAKLQGAYDWVATPQTMLKSVRGWSISSLPFRETAKEYALK